MKATMVRVGVLMTVATGLGAAQGADTKMHACSLLTSAEVAAAVGGTPGPPSENDIVVSEGPSKGETMGMCTWPAGPQASVSVALVRAPQGAPREAGLAKIKQMFESLKAQGWSEEKRDFGKGRCVLMTPPSSGKGMPVSTGCFAEAKGMGISVGHNGGAGVPIDKVKTLLDKAIGRLP
ncbi:MAG TPA: hypothetical protein VIE44_07995 [Methylomirabilota bacterium]|jgi:hypothetical protein